MADYVERLILDDSQFIEPIINASKEIQKLQGEFEALNKETATESKKMADSVTNDQESVKKKVKETTKEQKASGNAALDSAKAYKVLGVSINDVKNKLVQWKDGLKGVLSGMDSLGKLTMTQKRGIADLTSVLGGGRGAFIALARGVNVFKVALIASGIGAFVVVLGSLIAFFTRTQKGIDLMTKAMAVVGVTVGIVIDKFSKVGETIVNAFSDPKKAVIDLYETIKTNLINRISAVPAFFIAMGKTIKEGLSLNFDEAGKAAKEAGTAVIQFTTGLDAEQQGKFVDGLKDLNKQFKDAIVLTSSLEDRKVRLRNANDNLLIAEAKLQSEIAKQKKDAEDVTLSYDKRYSAAKKALELEAGLLQRRLGLAKENADIQRLDAVSTETLADQKSRIAEAQAAVYKLQAESSEKQIELNNKLNGLLKESEASFIGISDSITKLAKDFKIINDEDAFNVNKGKQLEEFAKMIKELESIKSLYEDIAKESKDPIKVEEANNRLKGIASTIGNIKKLVVGLSARTYDVIIPIEARINDKILFQSGKTPEERAKEIGESMKFAVPAPDSDGILEGINNFEDLWNTALDEIFGTAGAEKAGQFLSGLGSFVNEWGGILNEATDIQIKNIDKQLNALDKRKTKAEDDLQYELDLQKEGLANNVGNKQEEVDALLAEEKRLQDEREKLSREAERRQLIAETAQQTGSLITSSINIIKGFSNIPFIGLPLGIAAVGALLAFFASTKAKAFAATKLHTGADSIQDHFGFGQRHGSSDLGSGMGYRLTDERTGRPTNVIISGREMLLPERLSLEHENFFHSLRSGLYNGIDLNEAIGFYKQFKWQQGNINTNTTNTTIQRINAVKQPYRQFVPYVNARGEKVAVLVTIKEDMKDGSEILLSKK